APCAGWSARRTDWNAGAWGRFMRLCGGCSSKMPDDVKGLCAACKAERQPKDDGIRSNAVVSHNGTYDAELDKLNKGTRWQKVRALIVKRDPMCKRCGVARTEMVDHILPAFEVIRQAIASKLWPFEKYAGYYLQCNLQGLCCKCHAIKTAEDKQHVGTWPDVITQW